MAKRFFLLPMVGTGTGHVSSWHQPKYLIALGLSFEAINGRDFCLAEVWGDEKALATLAAEPDAIELAGDDAGLPENLRGKIASTIRGMPLAADDTGKRCIASLKQALHDKQVAERGQAVGGAVRGAIRG